ncbi:MAG: hypothetical protein ACKPKO_51130, partial [Candidatus Fonsibacter sp.]
SAKEQYDASWTLLALSLIARADGRALPEGSADRFLKNHPDVKSSQKRRPRRDRIHLEVVLLRKNLMMKEIPNRYLSLMHYFS